MDYKNYQRKIMIAASDKSLQGELQHPDFVFESENESCKDSIKITLQVEDGGKVLQAFYSGRGCILSQGSCALLIEFVRGKDLSFIRSLPDEELFRIVPIDENNQRISCFRLGWEALRAGLTKF